MTPKQIVKDVNAHCDKGNGIYVSWPAEDGRAARTQRCFRAKLIDGPFDPGLPKCYVTPDFGGTWVRIDDGCTFSDGNWNGPIGGLPITGR